MVGKDAVKSVRKYIKDNFGGEMPLYNTFIIPIENQCFRYLIYTAAYSIPNGKGTIPYYAVSSLLRAVRLHNQQGISPMFSPIQFIAVRTDKGKFLISRILSRAFTTQDMRNKY